MLGLFLVLGWGVDLPFPVLLTAVGHFHNLPNVFHKVFCQAVYFRLQRCDSFVSEAFLLAVPPEHLAQEGRPIVRLDLLR